jgi:hypothetical protein
VLEQGKKISGDYERAQVLMAVAAKARLSTDAEREEFLRACDGIKGDYEHARVLHALVDQPKLSPALSRAALASASSIHGDYEKAGVLVALAERHSPDASEYLKAASTLSGDYERSRALKALLASQRLDAKNQVESSTRRRGSAITNPPKCSSLSRAARLSPAMLSKNTKRPRSAWATSRGTASWPRSTGSSSSLASGLGPRAAAAWIGPFLGRIRPLAGPRRLRQAEDGAMPRTAAATRPRPASMVRGPVRTLCTQAGRSRSGPQKRFFFDVAGPEAPGRVHGGTRA